MSGENTFTWSALLSTVRASHPDRYRVWFDKLAPGTLSGGELRIVASDEAQARYLREHCTDVFVGCAMAATGRLISVRFDAAEPPPVQYSSHSRSKLSRVPLNPDYTFEQFVVGPSNRLAHAACRAVCSQLGHLYNPLFIHGRSGLGKTHLLHAICSELRRSGPLDVIYVSCEVFVNDFIRAIQTGQMTEFRESIRHADALIIDDVQFLANRESSQDEVFHTFNALYELRHQIVLSADSPPSEIPTLEDRLMSRFNWGLVAQIDPPNRETRHAILQKKARLRSCEIPDEVLDFIAEAVQSNIRVLEGALTKLISETQIGAKPMTVETARSVLTGFDGPSGRPLLVTDVLEAVSKYFGVRVADLLGRKRSRSVSHPRQVAMYLARRLTPLSLEEIGNHFGGRDHSTVLHAERVVETDRRNEPATGELLAALTRQLLARR
jgi:chromosomal replication initiator protein